ncbi:biopolymer transporter ExbB [Pseudoroseicyclus tamaricis]|uniref:Biopolymer transporter ExbB n=1 Tax=Pseudoroseicyclus tamaricis TaxID=2705421 RepID=A0A6B2JPB5_9RHOB|nr:biopolymer transporter ExbB [Pseudoroseicyclus tamaricis]NDU99917.1 biopolymer transporter ExbB [Pseudoroseicyclus tamaricis]
MSDPREPEAEPHFTQPLRQIVAMLAAIIIVGVGCWLALPTFLAIYDANRYLNGVIALVFVLGVLSCFRQVIMLMFSVRWIEEFASSRGQAGPPPSLLVTLATLLRSRASRMLNLSTSSSQTILDSIGQRIDEQREITRYLGNTLIFLGLLGTFYGLATTVPALVDTIGSLNPQEGESGTDIFERLQEGLQAQLGGMGTAFSSSLLGLAGSLIVGLLELFTTHGQNRFYRELEEWMSSITRVGFAGGDEQGGDSAVIAQVADRLAEQIEALQEIFTSTDIARTDTDRRLGDLAGAITSLAGKIEAQDASAPLARVAEAQEKLLDRLGDAGEGMDPESRMRLRSIDVQLLRLLEEMVAGRQETMAELRTDISTLTRAMRQQGRPLREVPRASGDES